MYCVSQIQHAEDQVRICAERDNKLQILQRWVKGQKQWMRLAERPISRSFAERSLKDCEVSRWCFLIVVTDHVDAHIPLKLSKAFQFLFEFIYITFLRKFTCLSFILRSWGKSWSPNSQNLLSWGRGHLPLMKTGIKTSSQKFTIFHNFWLTSLNRYGVETKPSNIYKHSLSAFN